MKATSARKENPQTWNRYSYTANDPVNKRDPWGLDFFDPGPCDPFGPEVFIDGFASIPREIFCYTFPIPAPPTTFTAPTSCSIRIRTSGTRLDGSDLSQTHHHNISGNPTNLGAGISIGQIGGERRMKYWFFLFEVEVTLPSDDINPDNWEASQRNSRTGYVLILTPRDGTKQESLNKKFPDDTPLEFFRETSHPGFYSWLDAPDFPFVYTTEDGFTGDVVELHLKREFTFELRNKNDSKKNCTASLTLTLDVDGQGSETWTVK